MPTAFNDRNPGAAIARLARRADRSPPEPLPAGVDPSLNVPTPPDPQRLQRVDSLVRTVPGLVAAIVCGIVAAVLGETVDTPAESGGSVFAALAASSAIFASSPSWVRLLPLVRFVARLRTPLLALAVLGALELLLALPGLGLYNLLGLVALAFVVAVVVERMLGRWFAPTLRRRIAVIGSGATADALDRELRLAGDAHHVVVGRVSGGGEPAGEGASQVPCLGTLEELGTIVRERKIGLLLMTGEAPRLAVFDEIARTCLEQPVRLRELSAFYEDVFGHVAVAEINASWFQYIMHPSYRPGGTAVGRALDLAVAGAVALLSAPLIAVLALIIRRDGAPAFFRQERIGEGGRPFTMIKLRTMREGASSAWAAADDPRVTRIGKLLRRTHLDELPQIYNVLRGDMRIVGPRPEQPGFVERLERSVPFYQRRHLIKPGLTGWAQVRCGYAGSEIGSAWKVCHDLFYIKHRSGLLDLAILVETLRTLVADPQYTAQPSDVAFILGTVEGQLEVAGIQAPG